MICFPNAKINLGLNIIEKREDGFHNIETVFYPIPLTDALEMIENTNTSKTITLTYSGIQIPGNAEDNLCVKAYKLISKDYPLPKIKVHLHKHIPIGAGLGGGSSDAAFFIKLLNEKFEVGLSWGEMHHYAKLLGSDCSFFISNKPSVASGKGDELESINLDLKDYYFVLVYPHLHINTAKAYSLVNPQKSTTAIEDIVLNSSIADWKNNLKNDFEKSVFNNYTAIEKIKMKLYNSGAIYSSMSGSGSSVFGLFKNKINAKELFTDHFVFEQML
jgi:4-diphosphocytidyl-2-C-methyl-D-erythritol kinase